MKLKSIIAMAAVIVAGAAAAQTAKEQKCGAGSCSKKEAAHNKDASCSKKEASCSKK